MVDIRSLPESLQESARRVGVEMCWPFDRAVDVIEAWASAGWVILGLEIWAFEGDNQLPRVLGWSTYNVELRGEWTDLVAKSRQLAERELESAEPTHDWWINVTAVDRDAAESMAAGDIV